MEKRKILDNMTGQEIKEMIERKEVVLENLSVLALNRLFDYESDAVSRDDGDGELLCRVADLLAEKEGIADEHDKAFETILANAMQSVVQSAVQSAHSTEQPKKKHYRLKKALLIAAAVIALACCATLVATAFGFDIFAHFRELISHPAGAKMEENGITLVHFGETTQYSSMEELLAAEELDIMYPTKLPEGVFITEVRMISGIDGNETVEIKTTDEKTVICIDLSAYDIGGSFKGCEKYEQNNQLFYIKEKEKGMYFAFSYLNDNYYSVQADSYEHLLLILKHLKE